MSNTPTPRQAVDVLAELLRRVPGRLRDWIYLALIVVAVAYIGVTAWRQGFTPEQLLGLFVVLAGAVAKANRTDSDAGD